MKKYYKINYNGHIEVFTEEQLLFEPYGAMRYIDKQKLRIIRKHMLNALYSAQKNCTLTKNDQSRMFWSGQIVAYKDILKELLKCALSEQEIEILNNII